LADLKSGQNIGPWELLEFRGEGGNAEVWRSRHDQGEEAAVKFLKTRDIESLRWERFRREIAYVSELADQPGVLPILEFDLPESPRRNERAWYSMPDATELVAVLDGADLGEVVEAVVPIARTLAELGERDGAAHRDLKPANLYFWRGEPVVGDFGLLWRPELADVTGSDIPGPFTYTAPELFREDLSEEQIDYRVGDVFSLAKTLWALARGQRFALPGRHDPDDPGATIAFFRPAPSARALDQLIARATVADPGRRPTMTDFADQLDRWLELTTPGPGLPDLSVIAKQIAHKQEPVHEKKRSEDELLAEFDLALQGARANLADLFDYLTTNLPGTSTNVRSEAVEGPLRTFETMQGPRALRRRSVCAALSDGAEVVPFSLVFGIMVEALDTGILRIGAAVQLGHEGILQQQTDQSEVREVEPGSMEQTLAVRAATEWIKAGVEEWLTGFAGGSGRG
jgi:serine/threonine protein kinase